MNRPQAIKITLFLSLFNLWLGGCSQNTGSQPPGDKKARDKSAHPVETAAVMREAASETLLYPASLRARRTVRIFNREEGRIERMPFYEGDLVQAGELLAQLDDKRLRAQADKAEATVKQAGLDLKRLVNLGKNKLVAEDEVARAETALAIAKAEEQLLRIRLSDTRIQAPFSGIVSARLAEPGDIAPANTHLLSLFDPASIVAETDVAEKNLARLRNGQAVTVRVDALAGTEIAGEILRIHPDVDERTRQGTIEIKLKDLPDGIKPGQFCRVLIDLQGVPHLTVPDTAVRRDRAGEYVFIVQENKALRINARTGESHNGRVALLEGPEQGAQVIVKGFLRLNSGMEVEPLNLLPPK